MAVLIRRLLFPLQRPQASLGTDAIQCQQSPSCRHTRALYLPVPWQRPPSPLSGMHLAESLFPPRATKLKSLQLSLPAAETGTRAAPAEEPVVGTEGWGLPTHGVVSYRAPACPILQPAPLQNCSLVHPWS